MSGMMIDKRKWDKIAWYLDIVVFIVLIAGICLTWFSGYLWGYWEYGANAIVPDERASSGQAGAFYGLIASIVISGLSLFWLFYRYFKTKSGRRTL